MPIKKSKPTQSVEGYHIQIKRWLFLILLICYGLFFLYPAFFNADNTFSPYARFPRIDPIGIDLLDNLDFSKAWLENGSPYVGTNYYLPLESVFFAPLTAIDFSTAFKIVTLLSLLSYVSLFVIVLLFKKEAFFRSGWVITILLIGLFSYGLLFELERGQYDLIAMAFCAGAIYLFHFRPRLRILSYVLFCIAVQLKVYPLIFIVAFVDYSQPISTQIKRWGTIILANLLLLFSLGWKVFLDFVHAFRNQVLHPTYAWIGNHSIGSFLTIPTDEPDRYSQTLIQFMDHYGLIIQVFLFAVVLGSIVFIILQTYRKRISPYNPFVIMACTLGSMLIPSTSHDYKLSLLGPFFIYLLFSLSEIKLRNKKLTIIISAIAGVISLLFSISLFVLYDRPFWLQNSFPLLLLMLLLIAVLFELLLRKNILHN